MRVIKVLSIALLLSAVVCGNVWAQSTAQMSGTVTDPTGALLPGVEILVTQTETGISRTVVTNETGSYTVTNLPLGPYRLEASLPGFSTYAQTGIVLQVGSNPSIPVVLEVGQVTQTIEVQANAAMVETRNLSIGNVMDTARITALPLDGRNMQQLLLTQGAAAQAAPEGGYVFANRMTISAAGTLGFSTEYTLDGIRHIDPYDGLGLPLPFPDALGEFKTEIGGMNASAQRSAQVSSVTKSGTNEFHGNGFWFVRNDAFNANNHTGTESTLKRNQFGGTVGGPVLRDRLFFFGGLQGTTIRSDANNDEANVPTAAMMAGDFSAIASDACNSSDLGRLGSDIATDFPYDFANQFGGANPFDANNQIDPSHFSEPAKNLVGRLPTPIDACGTVFFGQFDVTDSLQYLTRIDYQHTDNHSIFGRYMYTDNDQPSSFQFSDGNILAGENGTLAKNYAATVGSTYLISPTLVNSLRLSVTRTKQDRFPSNLGFDATTLGANVYSAQIPGAPAIEVDDAFDMGGNIRRLGMTLFQIHDEVSWSSGSHQFGFGGRATEARTNSLSGTTLAPNFNFSNDYTGHSMADFLLGKPSSFVQSRGNENLSRMNYHSIWAYDTWQALQRVTISAGLRWSPVLPFRDYRRPVPNSVQFDLDEYRNGNRSAVFPNQPPGFLYAGDALYTFDTNVDASQFPGDGTINVAKPQADLWDPFWNLWAPRVGLAWDVNGDGRTSVRASYSLSYEEYPTIYRLGSAQAQPPWGNSSRIIFPPGGFEDPWATQAEVEAGQLSSGGPLPSSSSLDGPLVSGGTYLPADPDLKPTYTQSWNLSVQREVVQDTLVSATYLGTVLMNTQAAIAANPSIYVPGVGDASGNCFLSGTHTFYDGSTQTFDGSQPLYYTVSPGADCSVQNNTTQRRELAMIRPDFVGEVGRMGVVRSGGTQNYHGMLISMMHRGTNGRQLSVNYTLSHCVGDYLGRSNSGYGSSANHTFQNRDDRGRDRGSCEVDERHAFNLTGVASTPEFANNTLRMVASDWRLSAVYRANSGGNVQPSNSSASTRSVTLARPATSQASAAGGNNPNLTDIDNQRAIILDPSALYLDRSGAPNSTLLNPAAFTDPGPGDAFSNPRVGGRNIISLPYEWQFDIALSRLFDIGETQNLEFRFEAFNVTNSWRPGLGRFHAYTGSSRFGRFRESDGLDQRILQFALKYGF